jgi:hypothetical protein
MVPEFVDDTSTVYPVELRSHSILGTIVHTWQQPFGSLETGRDTTRHNDYLLPLTVQLFIKLDAWPNGKALDYESRDSRFDP